MHVLSDFWTSLGVGIGLIAVRWTGLAWLDPAIAAAVALRLAFTGARLVRQAVGGLMDEEDPAVLHELVSVFDRVEEPGVIRVHGVRAIRSGSFHHIDAHLVVPEFWNVERAHGLTESYERAVLSAYDYPGEIEFHTDPCRQIYCTGCRVDPCPIRSEPFAFRPPLTVEEAVRKDPATREQARRQWMEMRRAPGAQSS
jgi:cation diffusion facilitator family transporter